MLGNYNQGLQYMDQALGMQPYALGYYYRGIMYQAAGRKLEAIQDLQEFLATVHGPDKYEKEIADAKANSQHSHQVRFIELWQHQFLS